MLGTFCSFLENILWIGSTIILKVEMTGIWLRKQKNWEYLSRLKQWFGCLWSGLWPNGKNVGMTATQALVKMGLSSEDQLCGFGELIQLLLLPLWSCLCNNACAIAHSEHSVTGSPPATACDWSFLIPASVFGTAGEICPDSMFCLIFPTQFMWLCSQLGVRTCLNLLSLSAG